MEPRDKPPVNKKPEMALEEPRTPTYDRSQIGRFFEGRKIDSAQFDAIMDRLAHVVDGNGKFDRESIYEVFGNDPALIEAFESAARAGKL